MPHCGARFVRSRSRGPGVACAAPVGGMPRRPLRHGGALSVGSWHPAHAGTLPLVPWYSCDPATCLPANNCQCATQQAPLPADQMPQFILYTVRTRPPGLNPEQQAAIVGSMSTGLWLTHVAGFQVGVGSGFPQRTAMLRVHACVAV